MGGKGKKEGRWGGGGKRHKGQRSDGRVFALKTADISFYSPEHHQSFKVWKQRARRKSPPPPAHLRRHLKSSLNAGDQDGEEATSIGWKRCSPFCWSCWTCTRLCSHRPGTCQGRQRWSRSGGSLACWEPAALRWETKEPETRGPQGQTQKPSASRNQGTCCDLPRLGSAPSGSLRAVS